jgi:hypothetical protein
MEFLHCLQQTNGELSQECLQVDCKENFMSGIENIVSDFKLRASYAEVGNVNI